MQKRRYPLVLPVILIAGYAYASTVGVVLAALGLFVIYLASLRVHPRMRHWRCKGTGEHHGSVFVWTHHKCSGCQGGRIVRRGAAIWGAGHVRREYARSRAARTAARKNGAWR